MHHFGCDYYPEHWPRERWEQDARMMREAGLTVVRMGEFSWHRMEPSPGRYEFDWLEEAVQLLAAHGIQTILGTPTAAPPAWLVCQNPEILPCNEKGQTLGFGGRHHDCQSSEVYRVRVRAVVEALARRFCGNPNVIGWQIDNELGNSHEDLCCCESCRAKFHVWLTEQYGTVEALNKAWGTAFWSQEYDGFSQIPAPLPVPTQHNPSLLLAWRRFCSALVREYQQEQVNILRRLCPDQFITHNFMGMHPKTDYFKLAEPLDFVANDQYPTGYYLDEPLTPAAIAADLDFVRGLKRKNFWMMEQQSGPTGGTVIGPAPKPGQLRLWSSTSVAHGADAVLWFRWRTCAFGSEQFWHGILPHSGVPGRRYEEIRETVRLLAPYLPRMAGTVSHAQAAILYDYDQLWAITEQPQHPRLSYRAEIQAWHEMLHTRNVPVDFLSDDGALSEYPLVLAPLQYILSPARAQALAQYAEQGGTLLLTMRTGVKNLDNVCQTDASLPGLLQSAAGLCVDDYDSRIWEPALPVLWGDAPRGEGALWCDVITACGAQVLARYGDGAFYSGAPAVTMHRYGKGRVCYVGTCPNPALRKAIGEELLRVSGVQSLGDTPQGVELALRHGSSEAFLFALNHTAQPQEITVDASWHTEENGALPPYGVRIYERSLSV